MAAVCTRDPPVTRGTRRRGGSGTARGRIYRRRTSAALEASTIVRWEEQPDPDQPPQPRRWGPAIAVVGLGVALVAGAALYPGSAPRPAGSGTVAAQAVDEPTGRAGLPHRVPTPRTSTSAPAPAPVAAPPVAEAAATAPATPVVAAATPLVERVGQVCVVPGTTAATEDGDPLLCQAGNGNGSPRWRKA